MAKRGKCMKIKVAPSILSANFGDMRSAVQNCKAWGADLIHLDVMDGSFVEPITFGGQMVKNLRPVTDLELDCHLMIEHPKTQIKFFANAGADWITVHLEACRKISPIYLKETLEDIKSMGVKCGVAINPDANVEDVYDVFPLCDMVLIMSVFPGYGGQKFIPTALDSIKKARHYANSLGLYNLDIEVDGGVTEQNAKDIIEAGANILVAGSSVFGSSDPKKTIEVIRG